MIIWLCSLFFANNRRRIVFHAARRADFLVGQAIRLSPPAVAGVWLRLMLRGGAGNLACSRLSGGAWLRRYRLVGQLFKLRADFIGASRARLISTKRPVGNRPAGCNPAPQCGKPQTELAFQQGVFWFRIPIATYTLEKRHETVYRKI
jgi:hypothetical protein